MGSDRANDRPHARRGREGPRRRAAHEPGWSRGSLLRTSALLACLAAAAIVSCKSLPGGTNLLRGHPATNGDGTVNVVIEIPAGTNAKWELDKETGRVEWETEDGVPRVVRYLPYPGNYGFVPRTLLPKQLGGDGDPLDVLVLGPAEGRGTVVRARLIGVLTLVDRGEQDDKLIAVLEGSPLASVRDLTDLERDYQGITAIVETWFTGYKGPGKMVSHGFLGADRAREILDQATAAFEGQGP